MRKINQNDYKKSIVGAQITDFLPFDDHMILDFPNYEFIIYHSSFWRVELNDDIIASSEDIYVKCRYETVDWPELFPHSIMNQIESFENYDEEKALQLLQNHLNKLYEELKRVLVNKTVVDITISPIGDVELILSDGVKIQSFVSYKKSELDKPYELLGCN